MQKINSNVMGAIKKNKLIQLKEFGIVMLAHFRFVVIVLKKLSNFGNRKMFLLMKKITNKMLDENFMYAIKNIFYKLLIKLKELNRKIYK
jgi:hypothetical protein